MQTRSFHRASFGLFLGLATILLAPQVSRSATWDGQGATNLWSNPLNWENDTLPAVNDDLFFQGALRLVNANNLPAASAVFRDLSLASPGFSISGNVLSLSGNILSQADNNLLSLPLAFTSAASSITSQAGTLRLMGNISLNNTALTFAGDGNLAGPDTTFYSPHPFITGNGSLIKTGAGTLELGGKNTFTGTVDIQAGTLRLKNSYALAPQADAVTSPSVYVRDGATLDLGGNSIERNAIYGRADEGEVVSIAGQGVNGQGAIINSISNSSNMPYIPALHLAADATVGTVSNLSYSIGTITGAHALTKTGPGTVYFGSTSTTNDSLPTSLIIKGSATGISRANIHASDSQNLSTYHWKGNINIAGGYMSLSATFLSGSRPSSYILTPVGNGAGQIQWTDSGGFYSDTKNYSIIALGGTATYSTVTAPGLTWGQDHFVPEGKALRFFADFSSWGSNTSTAFEWINPINLGNGIREIHTQMIQPTISFNTLSPALFTGVLSGQGGLRKTGNGTLTLTAQNTFQGDVIIEEGNLLITHPQAIGDSQGQTIIQPGAGLVLQLPMPGYFNQFLLSTLADDFTLRGNAQQGPARIAQSTSGLNLYPTYFLGGITIENQALIEPRGFAPFILKKPLLGSGDLTIKGTGNLVLAADAPSSFAGAIHIAHINAASTSPIFIALHGDADLPNANITLEGGLYQDGTGLFTRSLGTGTGQIQWLGSGGLAGSALINFSNPYEYDPNAVTLTPGLTVAIGGLSAPQLTWGQDGFVPDGSSLLLAGPLTWKNPILLSTGSSPVTRTISVTTGQVTMDGSLTQTPGADAGLTKSGGGTLILNSPSSYTGTTTISSGILRPHVAGALPDESNLVLSGGTLESSPALSTFTRALGTGTGQVQWTSGGGFSAIENHPLTVNIGGQATPQTLIWGSTPFFLADDKTLFFGSTDGKGLVRWTNPLQLTSAAAATRTITVSKGAASIDAPITDAPGAAGSLTINNTNGLLILNAPNTYTGSTNLTGSMRLDHAQALPAGNLVLNHNATFIGSSAFPLFDRTYGSGANQFKFSYPTSSVSWSSIESRYFGFAASGADMVVALGSTAAPATFDFAASGLTFYTYLQFGSPLADHTVIWRSPMTLNYDGSFGIDLTTLKLVRQADPTVPALRLEAPAANAPGRNGILNFVGNGLAVLAAPNTCTGIAISDNATVRIENPAALGQGTLQMNGGVLEGSTTFTSYTGSPGSTHLGWDRPYESTADRIYKTRTNYVTGGYSAYQSDFTINLGGQAIPQLLALDYSSTLKFGSDHSDHTVLWQNPIQLAPPSTSLISLTLKPTANNGIPAARIQAPITGTGNLYIDGPGSILLEDTNTYDGITYVRNGSLIVTGSLARNDAASIRLADNLPASLTRAVTPGSSLAGWGATSFVNETIYYPLPANYTPKPNTSASLLAGENTTSSTLNVAMSFRQATQTEITDSHVASSVFQLDGMQGLAFVLDLSVNTPVSADPLALGWLDPSNHQWALAVAGNAALGSFAAPHQMISWADFISPAGGGFGHSLTDLLGSYGYDPATGHAWAVLDHNSQFALVAIPEPAAASLLLFSASPLLLRRKNERVACS